MRAVVCSILLWAAIAAVSSAAADARPPLPSQPAAVPWPDATWPTAPLPASVDRGRLANALAGLFDRHIGPAGHPDHRAILVVHRGQIVVETYAPGFGPTSRFQSWSMAKSITNAFIGLLVADGTLELDAPPPIAGWPQHAPGVTLRHLLNMTAGLDDDGASGALLFAPEARRDAFGAAAAVPPAHAPGKQWSYSMASSNLLAGVASEAVGRDRASVTAWLQHRLFDPIGAESFVLEFDQTGHFIGGAFAWATARDWARLGYLYLRGGVWDERRLLPGSWIEFSRTPAPAANNTQFAAHFWVTANSETQGEKIDPGLNGFYMSGSQGQVVLMVPSRDLIVIRLGEAHHADWPEINGLVAELAHAFPELEP